MKKDSRPEAVLFDAGGVLMDVKPRPAGYREMASVVEAFLVRSSGTCLGEARVLADLKAAAAAYSNWKNAQSRRAGPREITHREFWEDFVAADWPAAARMAVAAHASELSWQYEDATMERSPIEGACLVLKTLKASAVRTGIVSNALVGGLTRALMREYGFARYLDIQIYSDETGIRKPNPELFYWATTSLGVTPQKTWYLGDKLDRDVLAGRRAGIGKVILLPDENQETGPVVVAQPDEIIARLVDLLALIPELEPTPPQ